MLRTERKWNHITCSVKTTKGRKGVEKNRTKNNRKQIENSNKYGSYKFSYINHHFKCQWSKYTN